MEIGPGVSIDKLVPQVGASAYRSGFCLPKVVSTFAPVWISSLAIRVLTTPMIIILMHYPRIEIGVLKLKDKLGLPPKTLDTAINDEVDSSIDLIASILSTLTIGMAFSVWDPQLLFFASILCPIVSISFEIVHLIQHQKLERLQRKLEGARTSVGPMLAVDMKAQAELREEDNEPADSDVSQHNVKSDYRDFLAFGKELAARIKAPVPTKLLSTIASNSLRLAMLGVMLDFQFSLGSFIFFIAAQAGHMLWVGYKRKAKRQDREVLWEGDALQEEQESIRIKSDIYAVEVNSLSPRSPFKEDPDPEMVEATTQAKLQMSNPPNPVDAIAGADRGGANLAR